MGDESLHVVVAGDVGGDRRGLGAGLSDLGGDAFGGIGVAVGDDDARAVGGESLGGRLAEAGPGAGHDADSFGVGHVVGSSWVGCRRVKTAPHRVREHRDGADLDRGGRHQLRGAVGRGDGRAGGGVLDGEVDVPVRRDLHGHRGRAGQQPGDRAAGQLPLAALQRAFGFGQRPSEDGLVEGRGRGDVVGDQLTPGKRAGLTGAA